jgi:hypothetical protein
MAAGERARALVEVRAGPIERLNRRTTLAMRRVLSWPVGDE